MITRAWHWITQERLVIICIQVLVLVFLSATVWAGLGSLIGGRMCGGLVMELTLMIGVWYTDEVKQHWL